LKYLILGADLGVEAIFKLGELPRERAAFCEESEHQEDVNRKDERKPKNEGKHTCISALG
jgi:hypothetical protein